MADLTPYQRKIVDRYYKNFDAIKLQRLSELATELYLAEGKKLERLWGQVETSLRKLECPEPRIAELIKRRDPTMLVGIIKEIERESRLAQQSTPRALSREPFRGDDPIAPQRAGKRSNRPYPHRSARRSSRVSRIFVDDLRRRLTNRQLPHSNYLA